MRTLTFCIAGLLLACISSTSYSQPDPQSRFQEGVSASRAGDHRRALAHFRAARQAGLDTPALHYNLGVSYYRTGNLDAASRSFNEARRSRELAALAHYNLGLIALDQGRSTAAAQQFREAERLARTDQVRGLARIQLGRLPTVPTRGHAWLALDVGYDSNVALAPESVAGREDDAFHADALLWGEYRLTAGTAPDIRLQGSLNARDYPEVADADLLYLQLGPVWHRSTAGWRYVHSINLNHLSLGGDGVERQLQIGTEAVRPVRGLGELQARLRLSRTGGGTGFGYLDGYSHDLRLGLRDRSATMPWFLRYDLIYDDREDLRTATTFQSVSPLRQGVTAGITPALNHRTRMELTVGYRVSRFMDADEPGDGTSTRRLDRRMLLGAGLLHSLDANWTGTLRLQWAENRSNRAPFDYDRLQISAGVERGF